MRLLQYATTNYYTRSRKSKWPEVFAEKLGNAPKSHKIEYAAHDSGDYETRLKCLQD